MRSEITMGKKKQGTSVFKGAAREGGAQLISVVLR